jgi:hypothetical protein
MLTFSAEGNNCPLAALAYFLPGIDAALFEAARSHFRPSGEDHLLDIHEVLFFYLKGLGL